MYMMSGFEACKICTNTLRYEGDVLPLPHLSHILSFKGPKNAESCSFTCISPTDLASAHV